LWQYNKKFDRRLEMIKSLQNGETILERLKGKNAQFILSAGYTKTSEIEGITVAGLPGYISYTPALDMEVLYYGYPKSMPNIATMPDGPPSPVIIASAVKQLIGLPLSFVDTGLTVKPKAPHTVIDSKPAESILNGASIDAKHLFEEGKRYAKEIVGTRELFILSECVPGGTTTAYAVTKALGYACENSFSSSNFEQKTYSLKEDIVNSALKSYEGDNDLFSIISHFGDTMQAFVSGMAVELSKSALVVLGGGTQMAAVLGILNKLEENVNFENITLMTTSWIVNDTKSDIRNLLNKINPKFNALYSEFSFEKSAFKNLRLYDEGYVKEGIGAGSVIGYAYLKGKTNKEIQVMVDKLYSAFIS
jgi:uncharacterized protein (TIGR00303 family)